MSVQILCTGTNQSVIKANLTFYPSTNPSSLTLKDLLNGTFPNFNISRLKRRLQWTRTLITSPGRAYTLARYTCTEGVDQISRTLPVGPWLMAWAASDLDMVAVVVCVIRYTAGRTDIAGPSPDAKKYDATRYIARYMW